MSGWKRQQERSHLRKSSRNRSLDGLRGLAILGVVLFHTRPSLLTGGFLGVTVFFVLGGFFATSSILSALKQGTFSYLRYIGKRLVRLFPPLIVTIAATALLVYLVSPSLLVKVHSDALPSALFSSNWVYIFRHASYFDAAGLPSPITHLWFLGVIMQFSLLWPLILVVLMAVVRRRSLILVATVVLAGASSGLMALCFDPAATGRAYYGTDTRAAELLVGAAAALAWSYVKRRRVTPLRVLSANVIAAVGLGVLVVGYVTLRGDELWLYRGGFVAVAAVTALVTLALLSAPTIGGWLLSLRPLNYLGRRSFAIYLVHFPLLTVMNPATRTTSVRWWEWVIQLLVVLGVSEVFYQLVETPTARFLHRVGAPVGSDTIGHEAGDGAAPPDGRKPGVRARAVVNIALVVCSTIALILLACAPVRWDDIAQARAQALRPELARQVPTDESEASQSSSAEPTSAQPTPEPTPTLVAPKAEKVPDNLPWRNWTYDEATGVTDARILMIGDSITEGLQPMLNTYVPNAYVDGKVSRQFVKGEGVYLEDAAAGYEGDVTIIALGSNGAINNKAVVQSLIDAVGGKPLYFVTNRSPYPLQESNNAIFREFAAANPNVGIIDWNGRSEGHPEYLVDDGTHLTAEGTQAYVTMIREALVGR
ncbi:acyltransferase [Arcanobacterium haemolyticum]|nr:acyltransferase [Arcanobacterium haemolyticum]